jgi:hypothetical protein
MAASLFRNFTSHGPWLFEFQLAGLAFCLAFIVSTIQATATESDAGTFNTGFYIGLGNEHQHANNPRAPVLKPGLCL